MADWKRLADTPLASRAPGGLRVSAAHATSQTPAPASAVAASSAPSALGIAATATAHAPTAAPRVFAPRASREDELLEAVLEDAKSKLKSAWIAGIVSCCLTMLFATLLRALTEDASALWVDVALIAGLTFGIFKKSRVCAVLMLVYYVSSKIYMIMETGRIAGIYLTIVFTVCYVRGVMGAFTWHRAKAAQRARAEA